MDRFIFIISIFIYLTTGLFSNSYYHPDEHYQIIEFAQFKSGNNNAGDLAWEFNEQIRPALQPAILFGIFSILRYMNINDPFLIMTIVRCITGLLALSILHLFYRETKNGFAKNERHLYAILTHFLWFLPFINVRYSSESYSGILLLTALVVYYSSVPRKMFLVGMALGLSFLFRFQSGFFLVGFYAWLFFIQKRTLRDLLLLSTGLFVMLVIGTIIDFWFYDIITFTPINYFQVNILQNAASKFGVFPWYFYIQSLFTVLTAPFALLILFAFTVELIFNNRNVLIWLIIPFFVIHSLIPHKELRFLFPMVNLIPLLLISAIHTLKKNINPRIYSWLLTSFFTFLCICNPLGLLLNMISPADNGKENIMRFLASRQKDKIDLICFKDSNPYKPFSFLNQTFFTSEGVTQIIVDSIPALLKNKHSYLVIKKEDAIGLNDQLYRNSWRLIKKGTPDLVLNIKEALQYGEPESTLFLYRHEN